MGAPSRTIPYRGSVTFGIPRLFQHAITVGTIVSRRPSISTNNGVDPSKKSDACLPPPEAFTTVALFFLSSKSPPDDAVVVFSSSSCVLVLLNDGLSASFIHARRSFLRSLLLRACARVNLSRLLFFANIRSQLSLSTLSLLSVVFSVSCSKKRQLIDGAIS